MSEAHVDPTDCPALPLTQEERAALAALLTEVLLEALAPAAPEATA